MCSHNFAPLPLYAETTGSTANRGEQKRTGGTDADHYSEEKTSEY